MKREFKVCLALVVAMCWVAAIAFGQTVSINGRQVMRGIVGAPSNGQIAVWNSTTTQWEPGNNGAGAGGNWTASGSTNSSLAGVASVNSLNSTGAVTAASFSTPSAAAGSMTLGDGGSHTYRISPQTMSGNANFQPDASAVTGIPLHTATGTNVVETHLGTSGGGNVALTTSPTIVTPTIASFANATHTHLNAAGGGTLDAAAVGSGVFAIGRLATGTPDGTKFVRDDGTLAVPAGGGSGSAVGAYLKFGGTDTSFSPANGGFTYYAGGSVFSVPTTTFTNQCVPVLKSGTIKGIWVRVRDDGTLGSSENVTFKISINGAAGTGTGVVMPVNAINCLGTSTSESIAVTAGQTIALTFTTPTWATPPTTCYLEAGVYME